MSPWLRGVLALGVSFGVFLAFYAAGGRPRAQPRSSRQTVNVLAAASLMDALNAAAPGFEADHPGLAVRYSFGASSALRTQVQHGAPADLLLAADMAVVEPLVAGGLVETPVVIARNRLALVVPGNNPAAIRSPSDLARPGLRLVTTAPEVPIGRYSEQLLAQLAKLRGYPTGYVESVRRNVVSREPHVRGVLARVEMGEADAAIVYETDAASSRKVKSIPLPAGANVETAYPAVVVRGGPNAAGGRAFLDYLVSPEGRTALRRHGLR